MNFVTNEIELLKFEGSYY